MIDAKLNVAQVNYVATLTASPLDKGGGSLITTAMLHQNILADTDIHQLIINRVDNGISDKVLRHWDIQLEQASFNDQFYEIVQDYLRTFVTQVPEEINKAATEIICASLPNPHCSIDNIIETMRADKSKYGTIFGLFQPLNLTNEMLHYIIIVSLKVESLNLSKEDAETKITDESQTRRHSYPLFPKEQSDESKSWLSDEIERIPSPPPPPPRQRRDSTLTDCRCVML